MSYKLEFTLDGLPQTPNSLLGAHWRVRSGHAKRWERAVWAKCWHLRPSEPLNKAKLRLTRFSSASPDYDGLVGSFKPVIDGLVRVGILSDDTMEVIGVPEYKVEKIGPKKGRIKVEVEAT